MLVNYLWITFTRSLSAHKRFRLGSKLIFFISSSSFNLSELILFIDQYLLFPSLPSSMCYIDFYLQTKWLHREGTDGCRRGKQKKYELNYVINSLTIMRIIQICYLVPSIKPYRIYNCLMVVRSHTNGEIEKTWWRSKNLKLNQARISSDVKT